VAIKAASKAGGAKAPAPETKVVAAEFEAALGISGGELPAPTFAEIAFAGRSNVGKSSLINTLVDRKSLVRTSSTPGCTRQINLFSVRTADDTSFRFVDLPGYGFAKRSKAERAAWATLIEGYLHTRPTLAALVLLFDVRRGLEPDDLALVEHVSAPASPESSVTRRPVQILLVATKLDKLPRSSRRVELSRVQAREGKRVIGFSSVTREGRETLWRALRSAALGTPTTP
jgi:GTP-binding protein